MSKNLLKNLCFVILLTGCVSTSKNSKPVTTEEPLDSYHPEQPAIGPETKLQSLTELAQTQYGGFILTPGFYEAEFKTYCLQPGTPDPTPGDAYLQGPISGYRKEIVESILVNSRHKPEIDQRNIQLLLWSTVSGADYNKLSYAVQDDARKLLTSKQIFELKGGVVGLIKNVSSATGILNVNKDMQNLFNIGSSSYEAYERIAVLREPSKVKRQGVKYDQWYKQKDNYYVRYFPASYKKVRIQIYVPEGLSDSTGKVNGEYLVFDPTGQQAIPAFTNAQRLGIGAPVLEVIKVIVQVNKKIGPMPKSPNPTPAPAPAPAPTPAPAPVPKTHP